MTTATQSTQSSSATAKKWLHAYRQMVAIRLFEEQVNDLYTRAIMPGLAHLYIGEEAVATGVSTDSFHLSFARDGKQMAYVAQTIRRNVYIRVD